MSNPVAFPPLLTTVKSGVNATGDEARAPPQAHYVSLTGPVSTFLCQSCTCTIALRKNWSESGERLVFCQAGSPWISPCEGLSAPCMQNPFFSVHRAAHTNLSIYSGSLQVQLQLKTKVVPISRSGCKWLRPE